MNRFKYNNKHFLPCASSLVVKGLAVRAEVPHLIFRWAFFERCQLLIAHKTRIRKLSGAASFLNSRPLEKGWDRAQPSLFVNQLI